jgi:uncharacterized protein (DUF433 family)
MTAISQPAPQTLIEVRDGVPVIRDTEVSPYTIAALARGETMAEIIGDYPQLSVEQIDAAIGYAQRYPRPGQPLPSRSFKRMLADMAQAGVWDVEPPGDAGDERAGDDAML